jgi:hypothetical protein
MKLQNIFLFIVGIALSSCAGVTKDQSSARVPAQTHIGNGFANLNTSITEVLSCSSKRQVDVSVFQYGRAGAALIKVAIDGGESGLPVQEYEIDQVANFEGEVAGQKEKTIWLADAIRDLDARKFGPIIAFASDSENNKKISLNFNQNSNNYIVLSNGQVEELKCVIKNIVTDI